MPEFSQLKLCFLAGTLDQGGAEQQLFYLLQALCRLGCAPRVLSLDRGRFWEEPIRRLGVPVCWVGQSQSRLRRWLRVVQVLRADRPAVLQSQHFFTNAYAVAAARLLRVRELGAMRNNGLAEVQDSGPVAGRLNLHAPALLAANSRAAIQYALSCGVPAHRLYYLPNVVDLARYRPAPRPPAAGPVVLLAAGRLVAQKRFDRFLVALAQVRRQARCEVKGILAGAGPLREALERQAAELGLTAAALEFKGPVADLATLYQQTDLYVLTSDHEGTPNVLLEAMASGLPIIATRVGGVPEIIRHGQTGFLLAPGDAEGLAAALLRLIQDGDLRVQLSQRARAYVEENHSLQRLPPLLAGLYDRALGPSRRAKPGLAPSLAPQT